MTEGQISGIVIVIIVFIVGVALIGGFVYWLESTKGKPMIERGIVRKIRRAIPVPVKDFVLGLCRVFIDVSLSVVWFVLFGLKGFNKAIMEEGAERRKARELRKKLKAARKKYQ